jgi:hypothetical protein
MAIVAVAAGALGRHIRTLDARRRLAVRAAQRAQQVRLARDLHDFVAHDVSEALAQAQARHDAEGSTQAGTAKGRGGHPGTHGRPPVGLVGVDRGCGRHRSASFGRSASLPSSSDASGPQRHVPLWTSPGP